ncbi:MAG: hypothetical protein RR671_00820 [Raoultibacter sp.]
MTGSRKVLNILSILLMVIGVLGILLGIFLVAGGSLLGGTVIEGVNGQALSTVVGGIAIVTSIVDIVIGYMGRRGAQDPTKIKPFFIICIIGVVLYVMSIIGAITTNDMSSLPDYLISSVFIIVCLYFANKVKQEA